jgi:hypothetical protein
MESAIIKPTLSSTQSIGRDIALLNNWMQDKNIKQIPPRDESASAKRYLEAAKNIAALQIGQNKI